MRDKLTICKVDQVESLIAPRVFQALEPELASSVCMSPVCAVRMIKQRDLDGSKPYLWNMTHWATVTMLSWVSLRAESFARTASSVYAILMTIEYF